MEFSFPVPSSKKLPSIVVQLGRIGDILNVIPAMKMLGLNQILVAEEFASVMEGFPYIQTLVYRGSCEDLAPAVAAAEQRAERVYVPQLFGSISKHPNMPARTRDSFVRDQWDRLKPGYAYGDKWGTLPLVVSGRHRPREEAMVNHVLGKSTKPALLVNVTGGSGPYPHVFELLRYLDAWRDRLDIIDLAHVRAAVFCDLMGLYEHSAALLTMDTATLHLARALPTLNVFQLLRPGPDGTPPMYPNTLPYETTDFAPLGKWLDAVKYKMPVTMGAEGYYTKIGLEVSTHIGCPRACNHCPQPLLASRYHGERSFTLESFQKALRTVPTWIDLAFTGFSEALSCKAGMEMIEWAIGRGHQCTISTTLFGYNKEKVDRLIKLPWKHIVLHLPSDQGEITTLKITPEYLELLRYAVEKWRVHPHLMPQRFGPTTYPEVQKIFDDAGITLPNYGLHDRAGALVQIGYHGRRPGPLPLCGKMFRGNLLPNGDVCLCCNDYGIQHVFGNLFTDDYQEIFRGEKFRQFIKESQEPDSNVLCRTCHDGYQQGWDPDHLPPEIQLYPASGVRGFHEVQP